MLNYQELYAMIGDLTPLPADCGQVCGAACCKGRDDEGMLLFPGEEVPGGKVLCQDGRRVFVCGGKCERNSRPLACRLFPLTPYLSPDGRVRAVYDPGAYRLCPLVRLQDHVRLQPAFVRAVRRVGRALTRDEAGRAFLADRSREVDELNRFLALDEVRAPICKR